MFIDQELKTYDRILPTLVQDEGRFVLIKGDDLVGVFETYADALQAGYEKFRLQPFLVKQIHAVQQVQYFTRELIPCRT